MTACERRLNREHFANLPEIPGYVLVLHLCPAIYKEDAKRPVNRTDKLSGDVLDVHNAPTDLQES